MIPRQRQLLLLAFLACVGLMGGALYFQYGLGLEPCPLCILQRVTVITLGVVFLIAAVHNPGGVGRRIYGLLVTAVAGTGLGIAIRHIWLQHLPPDQVPSCGPGLNYILDTYPLLHGLKMILSGSGECAQVVWRFLGFSIPEWTAVAFAAFLASGLYLLFARGQRQW